jgi:hypothetical protein
MKNSICWSLPRGLPDARSCERSGLRSSGDTNYILDLWLRYAKIVCNVGERVARHEAIDKILDARSAVDNEPQ